MRVYQWSDRDGTHNTYSLAGDRIDWLRHAPGVWCWSISLYLSGYRLYLSPTCPRVIRYARPGTSLRDLAIHLHLGWWAVSIRLGEFRTNHIDWLTRATRRVA